MSKPDPPAPLPRRKLFLSDSTEDDNLLQSRSTPQTPTKSPQGGSVSSTPPPVSPKNWIIRQSSGGFESGNGPEEIVKGGSVSSTPPPVSPKKWIIRQSSGGFESGNGPEEIVKDAISLSNWQYGLKPWTSLCKDLKNRGEKETKIIKAEAEQLNKAIKRYILLLSKHGDNLKGYTAELLCIADNLDKVSKGAKIAGITGGATTAAGGVAAAAGVILAPVTMGLSLALTAVGVGMAAAGGITGASAAIANKANISQSKKKLEKTFQEYKDLMVNIQDCLKFINEGLEQLKQHDLYDLSEARKDSVKVAKMVQLAATGGASARAIEANSNASGLMEGFALGIDLFIQGKNDPRPKKDFKSALGKKIRKLAEELNKGLDELYDLFSEHCSEM
ncbi:apolipoprotein L3-like [Sander vitreus]